jgi:acyl-coenzyme A thioesterase PaaI-like protein
LDTGGDLIATLAYSPHQIGNPILPALHGGAIGALLEHTALTHLMWDNDIAGVPKTIDVTVDYLRSGRPQDTQARALITKHGRRVANVRAEAWQDDPAKPIAALHGHFLLR